MTTLKSSKAKIKKMVKYLAPPISIDLAKTLLRKISRKPLEWEYVSAGWLAQKTDTKIKGWNEGSIIEAYKDRWASLEKLLATPLPLVTGPEHFSQLELENNPYNFTDITIHNTLISYGYALALSTRLKKAVSLLDWGGALGQYYLVTKALIPDLDLEYHCKDLPVFAEYGPKFIPQATFWKDDGWINRQFDFVLSSSAFHYNEDWPALLQNLAKSTSKDGHLFITQLPIVHKVVSFVVVQRPYSYGYNTEYLGWCLNRQQFLAEAQKIGLGLVREFIIGFQPPISGAPEQAEYRGYLFKHLT